ncbi:MAG: 2-vinyl bacteriochlorophyllide hydratase [Burkholderiaceae bacterium]|jgi:3-vinyl bacteriochlorophyllide hydratase|nr:2-vinyl bacteriochlorophyllide hydratase [Burkholderiaceae bacterium]MDP4919085.1 2-vinyl bacteriochlorophyllide hydratase [Burkholderiaceae bacterium]MDP4948901.1 2-vinyl bacteriochlorophyllide hydratase [Burkholderiaceae bacterium]
MSQVLVSRPLYTPDQKQRRDATAWTLVQGLLAPLQFLVFLISLGLIAYAYTTDRFWDLALASVVVKTLVLYLIMVTGAIWEKVVFGQYLFAPAFFWEDVVSMVVIALHTAYLVAWWQADVVSLQTQIGLALAAYATYVLNAGQFLYKLRRARLQASEEACAGNPTFVNPCVNSSATSLSGQTPAQATGVTGQVAV